MPLFTAAEIDMHISNSGKSTHHPLKRPSVPTSMRKAKTFLEDEYYEADQETDEDSFDVKRETSAHRR